jgi:hypothetical protein
MTGGVIDVWDVETFDAELIALLEPQREMLFAYLARDRQIFRDHDLGQSREILRPENVYAGAHMRCVEDVGRAMAARTIRAWHYTRMTDAEVENLRRDGIQLSTLETLRARLGAQVASEALSPGLADKLFAASPLNRGQLDNRTHRFWMVSHPDPIDDSGVKRLLAYWGGEVASFWTDDPELLVPLAGLGASRILEIAVPLSVTSFGAHSAGQAVVASFARRAGGTPEKRAFDICATEPLPPSAVLAVHTEGEPLFAAVGRTYPPGYIDVDARHWEEMAGDED